MGLVPSKFGFEPHSTRHGPFLAWGLWDTNGAQSRPSLAIFWPFLGDIVELKGKKVLIVTGQASLF